MYLPRASKLDATERTEKFAYESNPLLESRKEKHRDVIADRKQLESSKNEQHASRNPQTGAHYQTNPRAKSLSQSHINFAELNI